MRILLVIFAMLVLAGCAAPRSYPTHRMPMTPEQKQQALAESQRKADILRKLPHDGDLENLTEQIRLHELEQYMDIHGHRRSLNEPVASQSAPSKRASPVKKAAPVPRPVRKATPVREETISFDPLPAPIDILSTGGR